MFIPLTLSCHSFIRIINKTIKKNQIKYQNHTLPFMSKMDQLYSLRFMRHLSVT